VPDLDAARAELIDALGAEAVLADPLPVRRLAPPPDGG
jgi:hypothetical protein